MPDNKSKTGKGDDIRIDVNDPNELKYWAKALEVSPETLKRAVAAVGPMVADVRKAMASQNTPSLTRILPGSSRKEFVGTLCLSGVNMSIYFVEIIPIYGVINRVKM